MSLNYDLLTDRLLFAVPKKGRLHQACLDLLHGSDIQFHRHNRLDIALVTNLPMALVFLNASDIPAFVGKGRCDLGITGKDQVAEYEAVKPKTATTGVDEILDLGFGRCKLQVQVPEKGSITKAEQLVGKVVATSFQALTAQYFRGIEAAHATNGDSAQLVTEIDHLGGSVEAACGLGVADGIVDLVESGETMRAAGLVPIATVMETSAILVRSRHPTNPKLIETITGRIQGVITAQKYVLCTYNVERSKLEAAKKITPGRRAPTVTTLDEEGWVAVQAMVPRSSIAQSMDDLVVLGATDILVTKIDNSRITSLQ